MAQFLHKLFYRMVPLGLILHQTRITINVGQNQYMKDYPNIYRKQNLLFDDENMLKLDVGGKELGEMEGNRVGVDDNTLQPQQQQLSPQQDTSTPQIPLPKQPNNPTKSSQLSQINAVATLPQSTSHNIITIMNIYGVKIYLNNNINKEDKLRITNQVGDTQLFDINSSEPGNEELLLFRITNFLNPPKIVNKVEQVQQLFKKLKTDECIITTFIPQQNQYKQSIKPKSQFDTFTTSHQLNIRQIQARFRQQKYSSSSNKYCYLIIRNQQVAKMLKMNIRKIGDRYIFYKSTLNNGMRVSAEILGEKYSIKNVSLSQIIQTQQFKTQLYNYLHEINFDQDMNSLLRTLLLNADPRKILILHSKQKRPQFINQLKSTAIKIGQSMKNQAVVILTDNEKILEKYFQIIADDFVTVRLIDIRKRQPPILTLERYNTQKRVYYSRKTIRGPFTVDNVCRFITGSEELNQYYEHKKNLPTIPEIVSERQALPDNTVILYWKYGCRGCQLTKSYLEKVKQIIENLDNQQQQSIYQIDNPTRMKSVHYRKFNILNEERQVNSPDGDTTPKLKFYYKGQFKDMDIQSAIKIVGGIDVDNQEKVHLQVLKKIIKMIEREVRIDVG